MSSEAPTTHYSRLMRLHESSYLTLLSIVQGVATGFLGASLPRKFVASEWLLFLATFAFVVLVWAEYNMGVATLAWIPTFRDVLIPFALCMTEIFLSQRLAEPRQWFAGAAFFCVIAFFALLNMYARARRYRENEEMLRVLGVWKAVGLWYCLLAAAVFLSFAFLGHAAMTVCSTVAVVIVVAFAFRTQLTWRRVVRYVWTPSSPAR